MIFEGPVLAWLVLAMFPIAVPVVLGVVLQQVWRVQGGCLPLVGLVVLSLLCALGVAWSLNSGGVVNKGEVLLKREFLVYHLDGSWNRKMVAEVSYRGAESVAMAPTVKTLDLLPSRYDELNQGDFVDLRVPARPGMLQVIRLADQGVFSQVWYWLTNEPFLCCFLAGILGVLGVRFMLQASLPTLFFLSGLVTVGAWWTANVGIPWWDETVTLFGSMNSIGATVREVHPPYLGTGLHGWLSTTLYRPTDLILLDIIPVGHVEPILSVDEVDMGTANLRPGQTVNSEYSAANPRLSLVPDATRSFVWKNGLLNTFFAALVLFGIARMAQVMRGQSRKNTGVAGSGSGGAPRPPKKPTSTPAF